MHATGSVQEPEWGVGEAGIRDVGIRDQGYKWIVWRNHNGKTETSYFCLFKFQGIRGN